MDKQSNEEDDDMPQLSADTFSALQEFYKEQEEKDKIVQELNCALTEEGNIDTFSNLSEDWQLSQFWYDEKTSSDLANEVMKLAEAKGLNTSIACISCPTLYTSIKKMFPKTKCRGMVIHGAR